MLRPPCRPGALCSVWLALCASLPCTPAPATGRDIGSEVRAFSEAARSPVARDPAYAGFVKNVNAQRAQVYKNAAAKNNADAKEVGKVYAQTIMQKAPKGTWLLGPNNKWSQK